MSQSEALAPRIYNVAMTSADTEYSQTLPIGTKHFAMQCRTANDVRWSFERSLVATSTAPYGTIKANDAFSSPEKVSWSYTDATETAPIIYLASSDASLVMEIVAWVAWTSGPPA